RLPSFTLFPYTTLFRSVENRIWAIWLASNSDTANLLMGRAKTATDGNDLDLAIKLLNAVIDIRPDFVEAWNRRATIYYMKKDFGDRKSTRLNSSHLVIS